MRPKLIDIFVLVDSHCHLNFINFRDDADSIAAAILRDNYALISVGAQESSSRIAIAFAEKFDRGVYAAVGLHPIHLFEEMVESFKIDGKEQVFKTAAEAFDKEKYRGLIASSDKVKAIGEVGLDYYYFDGKTPQDIESWRGKQFSALAGFISLADELDLPLILHCRGTKSDPFGAYDDLLAVLNEQIGQGMKISGVVHCFGGNFRQSEEFIKLGIYIGITGIITFKNGADELKKVVEASPLEKLLIETDAPFLAPDPYRGQRNEPKFVEFVARKVAEIKRQPYDRVAAATTGNAKDLFNI